MQPNIGLNLIGDGDDDDACGGDFREIFILWNQILLSGEYD